MDLATLIGLVGAFVTVGLAIFLGGSASTFVNTNSLVIVFVGTIMVTLMKFSLAQFLSAAKVAVNAFSHKLEESEALIEKAVELANTARKNGLLALESAEIPDEFMKKGIGLVIDGHDSEVVRSILSKDLNLTVSRHLDGQGIFKAMGDVGPAMGMIGTLIGLVQMLSAMDAPKQIGPAMAIALLTTLYGAMLATMFALPIADKLAMRSTEEKLSKSLVIDAIMGIQEGQNPRIIEGTLQNYLPKSQRPPEDAEA